MPSTDVPKGKKNSPVTEADPNETHAERSRQLGEAFAAACGGPDEY